jgi:hypothetical protein
MIGVGQQEPPAGGGGEAAPPSQPVPQQVQEALRPAAQRQQQPLAQAADPLDGAESCVLKLKGLPYSAGESAIREFFAGYNVSDNRWQAADLVLARGLLTPSPDCLHR